MNYSNRFVSRIIKFLLVSMQQVLLCRILIKKSFKNIDHNVSKESVINRPSY